MKVILIYSGGLDSTVLLYHLLNGGNQVKAIGINYGQRHRKELIAASLIAGKAGVEYKVADLSALRPFLGGSSQTDDSVQVPYGHYAEENMKVTVVPNRNSLMLNVAAAWAIASKFDTLAYAAHAGDHAQYPDCRPAFIDAIKVLLRTVDWQPLNLIAPFAYKSKADIALLGHNLRAPMELTWSCYEGGEIHCGKCGTCVERREAFWLAGVGDRTPYLASEEQTRALLEKGKK